MAKIKLLESIHPELKALGLKPGDIISAAPCIVSKTGCMHFEVTRNGKTSQCSIWPQDYVPVIVEPAKPNQNETI